MTRHQPRGIADLANLSDDALDDLLAELATAVCRTLRPYDAAEHRPPAVEAIVEASSTLDAWALARDERMRRL